MLIDAIYIFFNAFCPRILGIYGRLVRFVRLVRCSVSTDPINRGSLGCQDTSDPRHFGTIRLVRTLRHWYRTVSTSTLDYLIAMVPSLFAPWPMRSVELSLPSLSLPGQFVPWPFCSPAFSLPGTKVLRNFCSLELPFPETFSPLM